MAGWLLVFAGLLLTGCVLPPAASSAPAPASPAVTASAASSTGFPFPAECWNTSMDMVRLFFRSYPYWNACKGFALSPDGSMWTYVMAGTSEHPADTLKIEFADGSLRTVLGGGEHNSFLSDPDWSANNLLVASLTSIDRSGYTIVHDPVTQATDRVPGFLDRQGWNRQYLAFVMLSYDMESKTRQLTGYDLLQRRPLPEPHVPDPPACAYLYTVGAFLWSADGTGLSIEIGAVSGAWAGPVSILELDLTQPEPAWSVVASSPGVDFRLPDSGSFEGQLTEMPYTGGSCP